MKGKNTPSAKNKAEKKPYEKPRIILEEKIEGRAAVCVPHPPGKASVPYGCTFFNS
jgi:hypothetical protein